MATLINCYLLPSYKKDTLAVLACTLNLSVDTGRSQTWFYCIRWTSIHNIDD